uniref:Uncharacterized protein n=1 Tax=Brugia malayi TaxID=6279 RepID=A8NUN0_BRUMA
MGQQQIWLKNFTVTVMRVTSQQPIDEPFVLFGHLRLFA